MGYFLEKAFVDYMLKELSALAKSGDEIKLKFTGTLECTLSCV